TRNWGGHRRLGGGAFHDPVAFAASVRRDDLSLGRHGPRRAMHKFVLCCDQETPQSIGISIMECDAVTKQSARPQSQLLNGGAGQITTACRRRRAAGWRVISLA